MGIDEAINRPWAIAISIPNCVKSCPTFLLAIAVLAAGCQKTPSPPRSISGQVFVVTRGRVNMKLGLVEVRAYEGKALVEQWAIEAKADCDRDYPKVAALESQALSAYNVAEKQSEQAIHDYVWNDSGNDVALKNASEVTGQRYLATGEVLSTVRSFAHVVCSGAIAFKRLPKNPIATAKTDADGMYTISLPRSGSYVLTAAATRSVIESTEVYFWAVRIPTDADKFNLTNENTTDAESSDSILHTTSVSGEDLYAADLTIEDLALKVGQDPAQYSTANKKRLGHASVSPDEFRAEPHTLYARITARTLANTAKGTVNLEPGNLVLVTARNSRFAKVALDAGAATIPLSVTDLAQGQ